MDVLQDALGRIGPSALRTHLEFERDWKVKDASLAEHFYKLILEQVMPYFTNLCTRKCYLSSFARRSSPARPNASLLCATLLCSCHAPC